MILMYQRQVVRPEWRWMHLKVRDDPGHIGDLRHGSECSGYRSRGRATRQQTFRKNGPESGWRYFTR